MQDSNTEPTVVEILRDPHLWRMIAACASVLTLALPWAYLDGATSSHSGLELIIYMLKGPERVAMLKNSAIGTLALFLAPLGALLMASAVAWMTYKRRDTTIYGAATALLPLTIMFTSAGVTSSAHLIGGGMVAPQAGPILLFLTQMGLIAHSLLRTRTEAAQDTEADAGANQRPKRRNRESRGPEPQEAQPYQYATQGVQHYEDLPDEDPVPRQQDLSTEREKNQGASRSSRRRPRRVILTPEEQERGQKAKEGSRRRRIR